jgi:hypothetical protein
MNEELKGEDVNNVVSYYESMCIYTNEGKQIFITGSQIADILKDYDFEVVMKKTRKHITKWTKKT